MAEYTLSYKVGLQGLYGHDCSVVLFEDGEPIFGVESGRMIGVKHGDNVFPERSIKAALSHADISFSDVDRIVVPYDSTLERQRSINVLTSVYHSDEAILDQLAKVADVVEHHYRYRYQLLDHVREDLSALGEPLPEISVCSHHRAHAASAFHPSGFDDAVVLSIDAEGECESTVVWRGTPAGLEKVRSFGSLNSLGKFYSNVTAYLGYRPLNGEGKTMGLAAYGEHNPEIRSALRSEIEIGADYDVSEFTKRFDVDPNVKRLEEALGRPRSSPDEYEFTQWEKDLAFEAQTIVEECILALIERYTERFGTRNVALAGGVGLNCKLNKTLAESEYVDELFVQPLANDSGIALGAGLQRNPPATIDEMGTLYMGPEYSTEEIKRRLDELALGYSEPDDLAGTVAEAIADGELVGWFNGRLEIGPRALGNRSILADPRTVESREKVNARVKYREGWRPFAPSILEERADEYLKNYRRSPYMIDTFDVYDEKKSEIPAVLHPADDTTRAQTVTRRENPQYYALISAFEDRTGVPVLLNTSFNISGDPIVVSPEEALDVFFSSGLDQLVLNDVVVRK